MLVATTLLLIIISVLFLFVFKSDLWSNEYPLSLVIRKPDNSILVSVFDPELSEITNIEIPGNTQVEVSNDLGVWKLATVWQLGEKENMGGSLLANTVRKNFKLPILAWSDSPATGFSDARLDSLFKATFSSYRTNLSFRDKLSIAFFSLGVKNANRVAIDLSETSFLEEKDLIDGSEGFVVTRYFPQILTSIFSDKEISKGGYRASVKYRGKLAVAEEVAELLENLGTKTVSIKESEIANDNCTIYGSNKVVVRRIAKLLTCENAVRSDGDPYDLEINLGKSYLLEY